MSILLSALLAAQAPTALPPGTPYGKPTIIRMAAGGNLRDWRRGPEGSDTLYVRDRTERWYQVTLTGPCEFQRPLDTLSYTTDPVGNFDRFSRLRVAFLPQQSCGVKSIRRSTPPAGAPVDRRLRR
ncbi:MAG TPA: hypothetical protein VF695_02480 [Sphingomonas sp.]|jgi:hypothetical protein